MIDKKLNIIRDKVKSRKIKKDDLVLTKEETLYLLRMINHAEVELIDYRNKEILQKQFEDNKSE